MEKTENTEKTKITTLNFVTGNKNKLKEFQQFLEPKGIELVQLDIDSPEMRSDSNEEISKECARHASKQTGKTVIVEDTGLFIPALNGFPGTYTKWVHHKLGHEGLIRLLEGKDRKAEFRTAIAYCEPGSDPIAFTGSIQGTIVESPRGEGGWGHDPIFIPENSDKTWAEDMTQKDKDSHRIRAIKNFIKWLENR